MFWQLVLVTHWEHCLEEIHVTLRQEAVSANALLMDIIVINAWFVSKLSLPLGIYIQNLV